MAGRGDRNAKRRRQRRPLAWRANRRLGACGRCRRRLLCDGTDAGTAGRPDGERCRQVAARVADGAIETRVLQFDPQLQAARASIASFTPTAGPALPAPVVARTLPSKQTAAVLPPPRPPTIGAMPASVVAASPAPDAVAGNWKVAGVEIPGSSRVRRYVPSGSDLLKPADVAWTVSKNAAVKTVASVGSFFGL